MKRLIGAAVALIAAGVAHGGVAVSDASGAEVSKTIVTNGNTVVMTSVYKFTDPSVAGSITFQSATTADILVVGGGGGGGAGGGGAGGVIYKTGYPLSAGTTFQLAWAAQKVRKTPMAGTAATLS